MCQGEPVTNSFVERKPELPRSPQDPSVSLRKPFCWWGWEHQWRRSAGVQTRSWSTGSIRETEPLVPLGLHKSQKVTAPLLEKLRFFPPPSRQTVGAYALQEHDLLPCLEKPRVSIALGRPPADPLSPVLGPGAASLLPFLPGSGQLSLRHL